MTHVLIVDDDPNIRRVLGVALRARGYDAADAETGSTAIKHVAAEDTDAVVLDLGLPDMDGMQVLATLRAQTRAPIIVLSGRSDAADKVDALDAGADDYVTKPFAIGELLARLRACTRRGHGPAETAPITIGEVVIDLTARTASRSGAQGAIRLTPTEWRLLEALVEHPGMLVEQKQLLAKAWGPGVADRRHYLRLYMARLRTKLEPDPHHPRFLLTEPGMGYRFQP